MLKLVWVGPGAVICSYQACTESTTASYRQQLLRYDLVTSLYFFVCVKADLGRNPRQSH